jgi:small subunit ribosomal protein S16
MLMIRLQRAGKKKQAFFRLVLQEKAWKANGKAKELLGFYNPHTKEKKFQEERIKHWMSKGAQLSATAHNILVDAKVIDGPKVKAWKPKKKTKKTDKKASAETEIEAKKEDSTEVATEDEVKEDVPAEEKKPEKKSEEVKEPSKEEKKEDKEKKEVKPELEIKDTKPELEIKDTKPELEITKKEE